MSSFAKFILVLTAFSSVHAFAAISPADYCKSKDGKFTEETRVEQGETEDFVWGQGGGCILRPLREVWAVALNQKLMVWGGVDESTFLPVTDVPAGTALQFNVHYEVHNFITVSWNMLWSHSLLPGAGTVAAPRRVLITYRKVSGTSYIPYWDGSFELEAVSPTVTAFIMKNQINASRTNADDAASTVRDVLGKLRTGPPNWGALPH